MREPVDYEYIAKQTQEVLAMLDPEEWEEIVTYLSYIEEMDDYEGYGLLDIADTVIDLDRPKDLPEFVIDYLTDLYETEIRLGNSAAMNDLGAQYYDGNRGFEQSFKKAMKLYQMAAEHGSRQAQENLGYCYYYGRDGKVDYEKAFHYFALGAFDGHIISLYKIGDMYRNGYYVKKNEVEAFHIYRRCIDTMTEEAAPAAAGPVYLRLGDMFLNGLGTEADAKSALISYQKAETYLYDMLRNGQAMYKKSLMSAIQGQADARKKLEEELPKKEWDFD